MIADGYLVGDGSWELRIFVTDLKVERNLRVKGDLHIGGVMLKLVEDLGKQTLLCFSPIIRLKRALEGSFLFERLRGMVANRQRINPFFTEIQECVCVSFRLKFKI